MISVITNIREVDLEEILEESLGNGKRMIQRLIEETDL